MIPAAIGTLTNLVRVTIMDTELSPSLVTEIAKLTKVERLDLRRTKLTTFPDFSSLTALTYLDLDGNAITKVDAAVISELPKLESFSIADNKLTDLPEEVLALTDLKWLQINGNEIAEMPDFGRISKLTHLYAQNNAMKGEFPAELCVPSIPTCDAANELCGAGRPSVCYAYGNPDLRAPCDTADCCDLPEGAPCSSVPPTAKPSPYPTPAPDPTTESSFAPEPTPAAVSDDGADDCADPACVSIAAHISDSWCAGVACDAAYAEFCAFRCAGSAPAPAPAPPMPEPTPSTATSGFCCYWSATDDACGCSNPDAGWCAESKERCEGCGGTFCGGGNGGGNGGNNNDASLAIIIPVVVAAVLLLAAVLFVVRKRVVAARQHRRESMPFGYPGATATVPEAEADKA